MKKLFAVIASIVFSAAILAQASVPYSNNAFSASFNNTVVQAPNVEHETNTDYTFDANDGTHYEEVTVRIVKHDIPVNNQSADFYADNGQTEGWTIDSRPLSRSAGLYMGHPFTYTLMTKTTDGVEYWCRTRWIIAGPREAVFIQMVSKAPDSDHDYWQAFENTLEIK